MVSNAVHAGREWFHIVSIKFVRFVSRILTENTIEVYWI